jgi:hypothetical protein
VRGRRHGQRHGPGAARLLTPGGGFPAPVPQPVLPAAPGRRVDRGLRRPGRSSTVPRVDFSTCVYTAGDGLPPV